MIRALTFVHRWLGVPFSLLFAMWFASGIVMHFVPFPALSEAERLAGLAPVDFARVLHGPRDAVAASGIADPVRVRLVQRSDGPVYLVSDASHAVAFRADDLSPAAVRSASLALAIAVDHARRRELDAWDAAVAGLATYDQWTVAGGFDRHRPLWRIALDDGPGTELYVSSATGEVVQDTTRHERWWNYAGSIAHWIYPTVLRRRTAAWSKTVWVISLVASFTALAGSVLGVLRLAPTHGLFTPYRGWHALHHLLGLICASFVLTWIVSGWLSMDDGFLFSSGKLSQAEAAIFGTPAWDALPIGAPRAVATQATEVEWFFLGHKPYRRDRTGLDAQILSRDDLGSAPSSSRAYLMPTEIENLARRLPGACQATRIDASDVYATIRPAPGAPLYRVACGDLWFQVDAANGAVERVDPSRRAYRWLFDALHTLDVPYLTARPALRGALIVILCGCGLVFSLTGCVIAWQRAMLWLGGASA
jgi:hypothetical protein